MSNNRKMKGLLKGLRYISQVFDEEKEQEISIGFPTDVKHVAHIGWDGPSVDSAAPSWMNEFKAPGAFQSAPLNGTGEPREKEGPEIKWVSEDSNRRSTRSEGEPAKDRDRDISDVPKSRRHASSENIVVESLGKDGESTKTRHSRKSKEGSRSSRKLLQQQDSTLGSAPGSPSKKLPEIPKKSRRKKSKEEGGGSTRPSRSKDESGGSTRSSRSSKNNNGTSSTTSAYTSPFSDPGPGPDSKEFTSNLKPLVDEQREEK